MKVGRSQPGGEQYLALQSLARKTGQGFEQLAILYALEGFLRRLAASTDRDHFVLKGGVLLAAFDARRPTRDADPLALQLASDQAVIEGTIERNAAAPLSDGLTFEPGSITSQVIRDEDEYSGIRVTLTYGLATMTIRIGVDVNVGDPVYPAPQEVSMPGILGDDIQLRGYPLAAVIAEKAVTGMQRGIANTRWRDWADIWNLSRRHAFSAAELAASLTAVAHHRQTTLSPLADLLVEYPSLAQSRWSAWRQRPDAPPELPEGFIEILTAASQFVDAVVEAAATDQRWNPVTLAWQETGP